MIQLADDIALTELQNNNESVNVTSLKSVSWTHATRWQGPCLSASSKSTILCLPGGKVTFFCANIFMRFRTTSIPRSSDALSSSTASFMAAAPSRPLAMARMLVVLPVPGGPARIRFGILPWWDITCNRDTASTLPTISSTVDGLYFSSCKATFNLNSVAGIVCLIFRHGVMLTVYMLSMFLTTCEIACKSRLSLVPFPKKRNSDQFKETPKSRQKTIWLSKPILAPMIVPMGAQNPELEA
jgi:hypothetical protein